MTELFTGDRGLAEGDSAIVGGNFAVYEDFEAIAAEGFDASSEEERVLEAASAEADAVELEFGAHAAADFGDDGDEGGMEARGDTGRLLAGFEAGNDLADHGAQVDVDGGGAGEGKVIRIFCDCGVGVRRGFEQHGGLAFEGDGVAEADEGGNGVEEASGG